MGVNPNNGLGDVYDKLKNKKENCVTGHEIVADIEATYQTRPGIALHTSLRKATNLVIGQRIALPLPYFLFLFYLLVVMLILGSS